MNLTGESDLATRANSWFFASRPGSANLSARGLQNEPLSSALNLRGVRSNQNLAHYRDSAHLFVRRSSGQRRFAGGVAGVCAGIMLRTNKILLSIINILPQHEKDRSKLNALFESSINSVNWVPPHKKKSGAPNANHISSPITEVQVPPPFFA